MKHTPMHATLESCASVLYFPEMHKIQELHALVCASCYAQYELLVLQNQFGPDSLHINYQQLESLFHQLLSEEEMVTGDQETFVFSELYDNVLEFQLLGVPHHMGIDCRVPIVDLYSDDMWQQAFVELEQAGLLMEVPVS